MPSSFTLHDLAVIIATAPILFNQTSYIKTNCKHIKLRKSENDYSVKLLSLIASMFVALEATTCSDQVILIHVDHHTYKGRFQ